MRRSILSACLTLCSLHLGCGPSSHVTADFERICNAEELSGASAIADPVEKVMRILSWLTDNLESDEAKELMRQMASESVAARGLRLREAAREAGYEGACPMADGS